LATVITNLLSAIPVFGKDFVELIWKIGLILNIIIIYSYASPLNFKEEAKIKC
jgi:quinol-cytochrome oxidoreductase complex cytochrome b subunit